MSNSFLATSTNSIKNASPYSEEDNQEKPQFIFNQTEFPSLVPSPGIPPLHEVQINFWNNKEQEDDWDYIEETEAQKVNNKDNEESRVALVLSNDVPATDQLEIKVTVTNPKEEAWEDVKIKNDNHVPDREDMILLIDFVTARLEKYSTDYKNLLANLNDIKEELSQPCPPFVLDIQTPFDRVVEVLASIESPEHFYPLQVAGCDADYAPCLNAAGRHRLLIIKTVPNEMAVWKQSPSVCAEMAWKQWSVHNDMRGALYILGKITAPEEWIAMYEKLFEDARLYDCIEDALMVLPILTRYKEGKHYVIPFIQNLLLKDQLHEAVRAVGALSNEDQETAWLMILNYCKDQEKIKELEQIEALVDIGSYSLAAKWMCERWTVEGQIDKALASVLLVADPLIKNEIWRKIAVSAMNSKYEAAFLEATQVAPDAIRSIITGMQNSHQVPTQSNAV